MRPLARALGRFFSSAPKAGGTLTPEQLAALTEAASNGQTLRVTQKVDPRTLWRDDPRDGDPSPTVASKPEAKKLNGGLDHGKDVERS